MFWSLVRPERILPPITRSAAATNSLEADESAVGMITCECSTGRLLRFDRLSTPGVGAFFRPPFKTQNGPRLAPRSRGGEAKNSQAPWARGAVAAELC